MPRGAFLLVGLVAAHVALPFATDDALARPGAGCTPFARTVFADMHDGDFKEVSCLAGEKGACAWLSILPYANNGSWRVRSWFKVVPNLMRPPPDRQPMPY